MFVAFTMLFSALGYYMYQEITCKDTVVGQTNETFTCPAGTFAMKFEQKIICRCK